MNNKEKIAKLSDELKDVQFLIDNINTLENISHIDLDLLLNKVRNLYEGILKLKHNIAISMIDDSNVEEKSSKEKPENEIINIIEEKIAEKEEIPIIEEPEVEVEEIIIEKPLIKEEIVINDVVDEVRILDEKIPQQPDIMQIVEENILNSEPETEPADLIPDIRASLKPDEKIPSEIIAEENTITQEIVEKEIIPVEKQPVIEKPLVELTKTPDEELLIEINGDYKDTPPKKPEIKQISLFGDVDTRKEAETKFRIQEKKESISEKLQKSQLSVNDVLSNSIKETNIASQLQHKPVTNIRSVISINDRIWFVKELFDNNNDKYNRVVDKINSLGTYNEAVDYLSSIFNMTQEKESLNKFFEIVQRRFLNK